MFVRKRLVGTLFIISLFVFNTVGCGSQPSEPTSKEEPSANKEPVTIRVAMKPGFFSDDEFQQYVVGPVKKKYANISVEMMKEGPNNQSSDIIARGDVPDLWVVSSVQFSDITDLGLEYDMTDLMKKYNFDLSRFESGIMDIFKTDKGGYIGVPYTRHFNALYYNKDIFDKFGVAYPKDGMTWDDAKELAKKLTRMDGGVQYRGLEANVFTRAASQLGLTYLDPATGKANVNNDAWKKLFETISSIYDIPGNQAYTVNQQAIDQFAKDKTLAMLASNNMLSFIKDLDVNWDLASYPTFKEAPGKGYEFDAHAMMMSSTSKHKDEAFQVISTLLSDEMAMDMSKNGRFVVLKDPKYGQVFATGLDYAKGKHMQAIFLTTPAVPIARSKYWPKEKNPVTQAFSDVINKKKDINTALRDANEAINQMIESENAK